MRKRVLFLLVFSLMFSILPFASSATTPYEDAAELLKGLSIIKGDASGDLKPLNNLTREESLAVLLRMLNEEKNVQNFDANSDFKDVPANHWAIKYISYAKSKGLTKGVSADRFGLGQNVTTKQFITFMLRALNHSADWSKEDIMKKASGLGLLKGSTAKENEMIKRGDAFIIMKNTLHTRVKDQKNTLLDHLKNGMIASSDKPQSSAQTGNSGQKDGAAQKDNSPQKPVILKLNRDDKNKVNLDLFSLYANVELILSDEGSDIRIEHRPNIYDLQTLDTGGVAQIKILGVMGYQPNKMPDGEPVKIYLPTDAWGDVKISLTSSVLKADKVFQSGNIDLESIASNVYLELRDEFKGKIKVNGLEGTVDLVSQDGFKDATFHVFAPFGVVNLPQKPKDSSKNRKFVYVNLSTSFDTTINVK